MANSRKEIPKPKLLGLSIFASSSLLGVEGDTSFLFLFLWQLQLLSFDVLAEFV
jgi:hypothetical protein